MYGIETPINYDQEKRNFILLHRNSISRTKSQKHSNNLSGNHVGESLRVSLDVGGEVSVGAEELDVSSVGLNLSVLALLNVLLTAEGSESPVLGDNNLLATREPDFG